MIRPRKTKPGRLAPVRVSGNAKSQRAIGKANHSPAETMALCLLLHTAVTGARGLVTRLALATDAPPFGLVEAADYLDEAGDRVAAIVASGGDHDPT